MGQVVVLSVIAGVLVKGWIGKLVVFPAAIALYRVFFGRRQPGDQVRARILRFAIVGLFSAIISGVTGVVDARLGMLGSGDRWSATDRAEINQFRASLRFLGEATTVSNAQVSGRSVSSSAMESMTRSTQQALDAARSVTDGVLHKIHPELRVHYREEFQRGLELRLASYGELSRGVLNVEGQIKWQTALDQWGNWYTAKRQDLQETIGR